MITLNFTSSDGTLGFDKQMPIFNFHYPFDISTHPFHDAELALLAATGSVRRRAIYLHIPFCQTICSFCPFTKERRNREADVDEYVEALEREFELRSALIGTPPVDTIFVGGGTPSMLSERHIHTLGLALHKCFQLNRLKEFTFEVEAKSVTPGKLQAMCDIGVNRISFGTQTLSERHRKAFRLDATLTEIRRTAEAVNAAFPYTNTDILYGLAGQTLSDLENDVTGVLALNTTTVDFYPINNLSAPRGMHRAMEQQGWAVASAKVRHSQRECINLMLRMNGFVPISGYSYSRKQNNHGSHLIQHVPKFLYHDLVYGHSDDEILGYGVGSLTQVRGFNLYNDSHRRNYVSTLLDKKTLPIVAFPTGIAAERGIVTFPFRGELEKDRVNWAMVPEDTLASLENIIEKGFAAEVDGRIEISELGWLYYVNLMHLLMPRRAKTWIAERIVTQKKRGGISEDLALV